MHKDSREDIYGKELNRLMISFFSGRLNILIIGAGKAASIKANTFLKNGFKVVIVGKEIDENILQLNYENLTIIKDEYNQNYLKGQHIIVIAIDDKDIIDKVIADCNNKDKIYINCKEAKDGMGVIPMNVKSDEIFVGINTLRGNPKASRMFSDKVINEAKEWDEFIKKTSIIRTNLKSVDCNKPEVLDFIISDDFKMAINKGKEELLLKLFYEKEFVDKLFEY